MLCNTKVNKLHALKGFAIMSGDFMWVTEVMFQKCDISFYKQPFSGASLSLATAPI